MNQGKSIGRVVLPINEFRGPGKSIFLIGPVVGAPKWHNYSIEIIHSLNPNIAVVCPNYHDNVDEKYWVGNPVRVEDAPLQIRVEAEIDWQERHINRARSHGCLMAWLPIQVNFDSDYEYARTTRFEISEQLNKSGNFVIGYEEGFQGIDYIKYKFRKHRPQTIFCNSLVDTCGRAVRLAKM